jgi:hypothetical protein
VRIGIDFDNTIACYDGAFHAAARERGLIPADLGTGKNDVRDYLNASGGKDAFTELQGLVYGARMDLAALYPGVETFFAAALAQGHDLWIVSHKTRRPLKGPAYDLHAAARGFLEANGIAGAAGLLPEEQAFFEETKDEKIARIASLGLDVFIDDLPEILAMEAFPDRTQGVLFDPEARWPAGVWKDRQFVRRGSWTEISDALLRPAP